MTDTKTRIKRGRQYRAIHEPHNTIVHVLGKSDESGYYRVREVSWDGMSGVPEAILRRTLAARFIVHESRIGEEVAS